MIKANKLGVYDSSEISHLNQTREQKEKIKNKREKKIRNAKLVDQSIIAGLIFTENDERKVFEKYHIKDISPLTYQFLDSKS